MGFDPRWETEIYGRRRQLNRYPAEPVVSFVFSRLAALPDRERVRVLEVGCGAGNNLWFLAREGYAAFGVDGSESAVAAARQRLADDGLPGEVRQMDFTRLDWPDDHFDCVIDRCSITHNRRADIRAALAEAGRVLKPGGLFFSQMFSARMSARSYGRPLGDGSYDGFTGGYFADIALTFFAEPADIDDLYGGRFEILSRHHVQTDTEQGEAVLAVWNLILRRSAA